MAVLTRNLILFAILAILAAGTLSAGEAHADERRYKIEAAYLYNFFNYIAWPDYPTPESLANPTICILGEDPVEHYLEYVQQRMAKERQLSIRTIGSGDAIDDCNLLYLRKASHAQIDEISERNPSILTVSSTKGFIDAGGMIELADDGERIAVAINNTRMKELGAQVSSRLLSLAQRVK